ncbi:MAG TPA: hypothetical protein VGV12_02655 [Gemmatimonadales bacterium]|nr:hypothetical protein [Gemmatimonadales bacterium]
MLKGLWAVGVSSLMAAACSSSSPPAPKPLSPCTTTSGGQVNIGVAAYTAVDPTQTAGCAVFPANPGSAGVQYLVIAQSASSVPDDSQAFKLGGTGLAAPPLTSGPAGPSSIAQQFDRTLRLAERALAAQAPPRRHPAELQYVKWQFRTAFPTFNSKCSSKIPAVFPLAPPAVTGSSAQLAGMLRAGSGNYYLMQQAASAPSFALLFSTSAGSALRTSLIPQLAVLRLQ